MGASGWSQLASSIAKRKVFLSYFHKDDEAYRNEFERLFGRLFINKSVQPGEINTDVSTEYIKRLIQDDFIRDASVLIVLVGAKTLCRKHVDWEISAALNKKVGGYSGLFGLLLPTHSEFGAANYSYAKIPERLADNCRSGYAFVGSWTTNESTIKDWIEKAFKNRVDKESLIDNSRAQMQRNTCE